MKVFTQNDPEGLVKRFEIGEYKGNSLSLVYTKGKNWVSPVNKKYSYTMQVQVEKNGNLYDILEVPLNEVFKGETV